MSGAKKHTGNILARLSVFEHALMSRLGPGDVDLEGFRLLIGDMITDVNAIEASHPEKRARGESAKAPQPTEDTLRAVVDNMRVAEIALRNEGKLEQIEALSVSYLIESERRRIEAVIDDLDDAFVRAMKVAATAGAEMSASVKKEAAE